MFKNLRKKLEEGVGISPNKQQPATPPRPKVEYQPLSCDILS